MSFAKLGDVAQYLRGINFKPDDVVAVGTAGTVACMRTKNIQESLDCSDVWGVAETFVRRPEQILQEGDILVSSANSWNLVGKCCWIPELPWKSTFGGFVSALRAKPNQVDRRFLYWWFSSDRTQALLRSFGQKTTSISNLNSERCLNLDVPLPSLPEQRRIAAILDQTDALRAKRREALAQLDNLTNSLFYFVFGAPAEAEQRYELVRLGDVTRFIDYRGISPNKQASGVRLVTARNIKRGWFEENPKEFIPAEEYVAWMRRGMPRTGDILFTTEGHTLGSAAKLPHFEKVALAQRLIALQPNENLASDYLLHIVLSREFQLEIVRRATGSAAKGISSKQLAMVMLPLPPMKLQQTFARQIQIIGQLKEVQIAELQTLDSLFASLQHRAFRGEL